MENCLALTQDDELTRVSVEKMYTRRASDGEEYAALDLGYLDRLGNRRDRQTCHAWQGPRRDYRDHAAWYRRFHRCNVAWPGGRVVSGRAIRRFHHVGGRSGVAPCAIPDNRQATLTLEFPLSLCGFPDF